MMRRRIFVVRAKLAGLFESDVAVVLLAGNAYTAVGARDLRLQVLGKKQKERDIEISQKEKSTDTGVEPATLPFP